MGPVEKENNWPKFFVHHKPTLHSVSISRVDILSTLYTWHTFSPVTPHSNVRSPKDSEPTTVLKTQTQTLFASYSTKTAKTWKLYLRNVYCVMTNHSKDQDMRTIATKPQTNYILACSSVFLCLIGFFLATQKHSRNICGVHGFPSLTVIDT